MKFSEMPYVRPDPEEVGRRYDALKRQMTAARSPEEALRVFAGHEKLQIHLQTMDRLASIRHTLDTTDAFYDAESSFFDENGPVMKEKLHEFMQEVLRSPYRPQLEEHYGRLMFIYADDENRCFRPEIIPDLQEESRLESAYQKLTASAQIPFDGKILNLPQMTVYKQHPDRGVRRAAYFAEGGFYASHQEELDDLFDRLVRVRTRIARSLGFSTFTELGYLRMQRTCFDPAAVSRFREQIVRDVVPLVCRLKREQSRRIGVPDMKFYDDTFSFPEGNPRPIGTAGEILDAGRRMYEEMSPRTAEFIHFMYDHELLDVQAGKGKAVGGYCEGLPEYGAPFIFSNFNGTVDDVDVLTHEAGHAFAVYSVRHFDALENISPAMESAEIHSIAMEFFAWPWLPLFYGDRAPLARRMHLENTLTFLPYGTMVDHFQHIVYDHPELTPAQRHAEWMRLEGIYRPYLDFEDIPFYSAGAGWQRQLHIFGHPFYYIDYCLAKTEALQFWTLSLKDRSDAWERYLKLVEQGGRQTFTELCQTAGLPTPFDSDCLRTVVRAAEQWLREQA